MKTSLLLFQWIAASYKWVLITLILFQAVSTVHAELLAPGYTIKQAAAGKLSYDKNCASCHGQTLSDGEFAPPLKGESFMQSWGGKTLDKLFIKTATSMPTAAPNSLGDKTYADILAYLLQSNGVAVDKKRLASKPAVLAQLLIPTSANYPSGGVSADVRLQAAENAPVNPLDDFRPVTEAMLAKAPAGDWLTWRRANDASGYSPLKQINRRTVNDLRVAWSWGLPAGPSTTVPLAHDGVLFVHGWGDVMQAIDGVTGTLLWQYKRWIPDSVPVFNYRKRSFALYGKYIYLPASDGHMVALDAKSGELVWETKIADLEKGFSITGGPLLAKGKVMIGTSGGAPGGNYIVALDALTGEPAWRFNTIPKPGEPGGDSWNGLSWEARNGGSVWTVGNYDAESGLAFFGPAPTYDTGPLAKSINKPGITNAALYTNATIALDPDTGKLIWHYQHFVNDQWDQDWAFERHIFTQKIKGKSRTVVATGGKLGIYDVLEAKNGKYIGSVDLGIQNIVTGIDAKTGAKEVNFNLQPSRGKTVTVCPNNAGGKNWMPSAYNPLSKLLFVPLMEICMDMIPVAPGEKGFLTTGVRLTARPLPGSDGKYGRLQAINLEDMNAQWTHRQRAPLISGVLATAGELVFVGDVDRFIRAFDQDDGKELWRLRLNDVVSSAPITYSAKGKQYLAVTVGHGVIAVDRKSVVPEITLPLTPVPTLWVFELPNN